MSEGGPDAERKYERRSKRRPTAKGLRVEYKWGAKFACDFQQNDTRGASEPRVFDWF